MTRVWSLFIVCLALFACDAARRSVAPMGEYDAYRRYRIAPTVDAKLSAAYDYLVRHPRGRWRSDVEDWFAPTQKQYVEAAWDDLRALRHFLGLVPDGVVARRAADRVVELELTRTWHAEREAEFEQYIRDIDARLARAQTGRRRLVKEWVSWTRLVSGIRNWGRRTHELDHEFIYAFRLTDPEGKCRQGRCVKPLSLSYAIPEDKSQSERLALLDVVMMIRDGGVDSITLTGPELFTRLGEALFLRPILPTDLRGRTEALVRVTQLVEAAVEQHLPAARCRVEPVSPTLLHRRCEGTELRLVASTDPSEEDRLVVRAAPTPHTPAPGEDGAVLTP